MLEHKIDFTVLVTATNANPNGDPLNGNRPRESITGLGEISDVCIKRKIRNRLQDMGEEILVVSDDYRKPDDKFDSIHSRVDSVAELKNIYSLLNNKKKKEESKKSRIDLEDEFQKAACEKWIDVRSFGQVFALKQKSQTKNSNTENKDNDSGSVSIGVRGPVSIQPVFSVNSVDVITTKITKSTSNESGDKKGPDTMGEKHRVAFGLYVINGSINCQLADKTGFSAEDADKIKDALTTLFENDASSARPEGSMEVCRVYWWEHDCRTPSVSSAKIHRSVKIRLKDGIKQPTCFDDYEITVEDTGVKPEIIDLI